jgi:hypothetical protein
MPSLGTAITVPPALSISADMCLLIILIDEPDASLFLFILLINSRHIRELLAVTLSLGLELHRQKRFIGRIDGGFDFLGYRIHPSRKLRPSTESLHRLATRARRLYE